MYWRELRLTQVSRDPEMTRMLRNVILQKIVNPASPLKEFSTKFFNICANPGGASRGISGLICPCHLVGENHENSAGCGGYWGGFLGSLSLVGLCVLAVRHRRRVMKRYGIVQVADRDRWACLFPCCTALQTHRELEIQETIKRPRARRSLGVTYDASSSDGIE